MSDFHRLSALDGFKKCVSSKTVTAKAKRNGLKTLQKIVIPCEIWQKAIVIKSFHWNVKLFFRNITSINLCGVIKNKILSSTDAFFLFSINSLYILPFKGLFIRSFLAKICVLFFSSCFQRSNTRLEANSCIRGSWMQLLPAGCFYCLSEIRFLEYILKLHLERTSSSVEKCPP